jgi:transcriptional regulator with XRE-family HTH domain
MWSAINTTQARATSATNHSHGDRTSRTTVDRSAVGPEPAVPEPAVLALSVPALSVVVTVDHYSDRMAAPRNPRSPDGPVEFDPVAFARALLSGRRRLDWSTRDLAARAGISQPYVVALERAAAHPARPGRTPTVDVVARLAHALGFDAAELFSRSMRNAGRHTLLVTDDAQAAAVQVARRRVGRGLDAWVVARTGGTDDDILAIDLRRSAGHYRPAAITAALGDELRRLAPAVEGRHIGLVFAETSAVMSNLDDPATIFDFEHRWGEVVGSAAAAVGAHAAYNVCVYESDALAALAHPVDAVVDLLRSHDEVWSARHGRLTTGAGAARQVLGRLRPAGHGASAWRHTVDDIINDLGLAA